LKNEIFRNINIVTEVWLQLVTYVFLFSSLFFL